MKIVVRCLCLLMAAIVCQTYLFDEDQEIEVPEECEISTSNRIEYYLSCPNFLMTMEAYYPLRNLSLNFLEKRSTIQCTIECSPQSQPYKYLPHLKSKLKSLVFENCQPPEHGSFGEGWPDLESLTFKNHEDFGPLTHEHFSGLNNLWNLKLLINSTHQMPDDIFSDLTKLRVVEMYVNQANKNIFSNLNELQSLHITITSRESLNNFDTSPMKNLPAFKTFKFFGGPISNHRLTKRFFEGCLRIEYLKIYYAINAIDSNALEPLANLRNVEFLFNKLESFPDGLFSRNKKLEKVLIFNEKVASLPSGFLSNLPNLREIVIKCKLTSIPNDLIRGSINLEVLDLQFNKLTSIPSDLLENHTKLKTIKLYGNEFNYESATFLFPNKAPLTEITFNY